MLAIICFILNYYQKIFNRKKNKILLYQIFWTWLTLNFTNDIVKYIDFYQNIIFSIIII